MSDRSRVAIRFTVASYPPSTQGDGSTFPAHWRLLDHHGRTLGSGPLESEPAITALVQLAAALVERHPDVAREIAARFQVLETRPLLGPDGQPLPHLDEEEEVIARLNRQQRRQLRRQLEKQGQDALRRVGGVEAAGFDPEFLEDDPADSLLLDEAGPSSGAPAQLPPSLDSRTAEEAPATPPEPPPGAAAV